MSRRVKDNLVERPLPAEVRVLRASPTASSDADRNEGRGLHRGARLLREQRDDILSA